MRKKELLRLNGELFSKLETARAELEEKTAENKKLAEKINALNAEIDRLREKKAEENPLKNLEKKVIGRVDLPNDKEYGASVIGKIVIEATMYCNRLTNSPEDNANKELVNLILGRTEVAKAEILKAVSGSLDFESKKTIIDNEFSQAVDYFESVLAQI